MLMFGFLVYFGVVSQVSKIFDLAAANKITIYTSEPILADVEEILTRRKFQSKINALNTSVQELLFTVKQLSNSCIITSVEVPQLRDPDDTVILATALSANAKAIIISCPHN